MFDIKKAKIKVDTRERNKKGDPKETYNMVKEICPAAMEEFLPVGDINYNDIYIELKEIMDFVSSITDGRFRNQLHNLRKENVGLRVYYFIYFDDEKVTNWKDISKFSKIHPNAVWGAITSALFRYGVYCFPFPTKKHAIWSSVYGIEKAYDGKEVKPQTYYMDEDKVPIKDEDGNIIKYKVTTDVRAINFLRVGAEKCQERAVINALTEYNTPINMLNELVKDPKGFTKKVKFWGKETTDRYLEMLNYNFNDPVLRTGLELSEKEEKEEE